VIKRVSGKIVKGTISSTLSSVLSDYAAPYTYTLPTARWTDGIYRLYSEVTFSDDFVAVMPVLQVTFANGVTVAPVSNNTWTPFSVGGSSATLAAVGDGAGGLPGATAVGSLVTGWNPNMFLYLGDVYNSGTYTEFLNYYQPTLGALKSRTNPVPGNHETGNRYKGYYDYWDTSASKLYYSTDAAGWHLVGLDSNTSAVPGSAQYTWLQQDLAAHADQCTAVFYHHPRFGLASGGGSTSMDAVWQLMATNGVDVVLTGHEHNYQRWKPMNANGAVDAAGITQFVVGTGGHELMGFARSDARVATRISGVDGALKLTLSSSGASYQFIATSGTVRDSGTVPCQTGTPGPTATPTPTPTNTATPIVSGNIAFGPVADSRVDEALPTQNMGTSSSLRTDAGAGVNVESYLRFTVSGVSGPISSATLRIFVRDGSKDGPAAYSSGTGWTETGITWANRPGRTSGVLDDIGNITTGSWLELDVTSAVTGNGEYSFVLATGSTDGTSMNSRQNATDTPELVLAIGGGPPPTTTPTPTSTATPNPTSTVTTTATPTSTVMSTASATTTATAANTTTATPTSTATATPTRTATPIPQPTSTSTATVANTPAATATFTPIPPTSTATATVVADATLFSDGFETGNLSKWSSTTSVTVQGEVVAEGSWAARAVSAASGSSWARANLASAQDQVYARIKFDVVAQGNNEATLLRLRTASNTLLVSVYMTPQGRLGLRAGGLTFTSTTTVTKAAWNELEVRAVINGGAGETEVWLNGQRIDALARSVNLGTAAIARIEIGDTATTRTFDIAVDDVLVSTSPIVATITTSLVETSELPTSTAVPPTVTATPVPPTDTATPVLATSTPEPTVLTETPVPATTTTTPTDTPSPPTVTPVPSTPTDTPVAPTPTAMSVATP
jgi:hypothetical protein